MENKTQINSVIQELSRVVVGQEELKTHILTVFIAKWHILIEWAPWLAKTLTVSSFAKTLWLKFQRIQFTPDLLPSDIIWARIYNPETRSFEVKKWPIFANIILADEINRAPSKVQSALLEAMQERQVTIWEETFPLPSPFMVLATQNPLEQEWTFPLPEAQLDRFLMHHTLQYPNYQEEMDIIKHDLVRNNTHLKKILSKKEINTIQDEINFIQIQEDLYTYILNIVRATRDNKKYPEIMYWASPRASIALLKTAYAHATIKNRNFVLPEDIKTLAPSILRHRIILSYESLAENIVPDDIIKKILDNTPIV